MLRTEVKPDHEPHTDIDSQQSNSLSSSNHPNHPLTMELSPDLAAPAILRSLLETRLRDREGANEQRYADNVLDTTEEYLRQCAHFQKLGSDNPVAIAALAKLKLGHVETLAVLAEAHAAEAKTIAKLRETLLPHSRPHN